MSQRVSSECRGCRVKSSFDLTQRDAWPRKKMVWECESARNILECVVMTLASPVISPHHHIPVVVVGSIVHVVRFIIIH